MGRGLHSRSLAGNLGYLEEEEEEEVVVEEEEGGENKKGGGRIRRMEGIMYHVHAHSCQCATYNV